MNKGGGDGFGAALAEASTKVNSMSSAAAGHIFGTQKVDILRNGDADGDVHEENIEALKSNLANRAGESRSPYVRAHSKNPVAWQLWGDEAIALAKAENKLIFVSIGYSACHWCHVMERESFENEEIAYILNTQFVPIKIDREERPDIDRIYMNFVQATTGSGGWPLNVFITPTLEPVFGGTYWPGPNSSTQQMPLEEQVDFLGILKKLSTVWKDQEDRCRQDAASILIQLKEFAAEGTFGARLGAGPSSLDLELLEEAYQHLATTYDRTNGGFGGAPKFPTPAKLSYLLRLPLYPAAVTDMVGLKECMTGSQMAITTLRAMARGGIHDQIGHGFARYSVTADWSLPHFEKMLYDNAQLLNIYLDAFLETSDPELLGVVYDIAAYLTTDALAAPNGGFYSSEDADSFYRKGDVEKREGAFYVWTQRELDTLLSPAAASVAAAFWGVSEHGNVEPENDTHDEFINQNVLKIVSTPKTLAGQFGMSEAEVVKTIKESREKLRKHRDNERVRPSLDDKIITSWNGLAIGVLARTSRSIQKFDPDRATAFMNAAKKAAEFIKKEMWNSEKKIVMRVWRDGVGETEGFADDYAFLIEGLIDLYEATFEEGWLKWADELMATQIDLFLDRTSTSLTQDPTSLSTTSSQPSPTHGFFSTPSSAAHTILRLKDGMDTSEPSTNGTSCSNLYRLSSLLEDTEYAKIAGETASAFESEMLQYPWLFVGFMPGIVAGAKGVGAGVGVRGVVVVLPEGEDVESVGIISKFTEHFDKVEISGATDAVSSGNLVSGSETPKAEPTTNTQAKASETKKSLQVLEIDALAPRARGGLSTVMKIRLDSSSSWLRERNSLLRNITAPKDGKPRVYICEGGICKLEGVDESIDMGGQSSFIAEAAVTRDDGAPIEDTVEPTVQPTLEPAVEPTVETGVESITKPTIAKEEAPPVVEKESKDSAPVSELA